MINTLSIYRITTVIFILIAAFPLLPGQAFASDTAVRRIAVLPVHVNSTQDLNYIKKGMAQMFDTRLSWNQKVEVVSGARIKKLTKESQNISRTNLIKKISDQTGSHFALSCIVTELSGSFSIDAKVYDIEKKKYMAFFEHSKKMDDLIKKTDRMAATINKKVFGHITGSWEKIEMERQKNIDRLKRRNPEYLIKNRRLEKDDDAYGWKIWKHLF